MLASGQPNSPQNSIRIVQMSLQREFIARGHEASCYFANDVVIRVKRIVELEFSLKLAFLKPLDCAGVLDIKVGDGLFDTVLRKFVKRRAKQLLVARSHGLDHINFGVRRAYFAANGLHMTWREKVYAGRYLLWQVRTHMLLADVCLFLNAEERDYATGKLGIDAQKCFIVDNGLPNYLVGLPLREKTASATLRIAVIGAYTVRKLNAAPTAISKLLEKNADVSVGFLGTMADDAKVFADYDAAVHSRITNLQRYDHASLPELLANYDVLFFPSMADGFGMVVFEAMACGLGIVASNLPSLRSRLKDGRDAIFFERFDVDAMMHAIERLVTDPELLATIRREGHARAQQYSWSSIADRTLAIYADARIRKASK